VLARMWRMYQPLCTVRRNVNGAAAKEKNIIPQKIKNRTIILSTIPILCIDIPKN
jgi:hypothetical protein